MDQSSHQHTAESYDAVAKIYAEKFQNELDHKPFDRKMLELLTERVGTDGTICDLGCGPGQIAAYLHQLGAKACGVDLSSQMIAEAQQLYPDIPFQQGDMLNFENLEDNSLAGIAAFYCIIHIPKHQVVTALREIYRVLQPDGYLLLTFHIGDEIRHLDDWFDKPVNIDFIFHQVTEMKGYLTQAGFTLSEVIEREPYPEEAQTQRAYIFARKS